MKSSGSSLLQAAAAGEHGGFSREKYGHYLRWPGGTLYWYMTPGIVAESDLAGNLQSEYVFFNGERVARRDYGTSAGVFYYFSDHLKTASVITDSLGAIQAESDYYPWGGELQFINNDSNHYKFTGKERDTESGLDLMGARYYGSALGRFMTTDPLYIEVSRLANPQMLNLYAYAVNNPVTLSDPTGLDVGLKCDTGANCGQAVKDFNGRNGAQFKTYLGKDNKLHIVKGSVAKNLSKAEAALKSAITNTAHHATINVSGDTGQSEFGVHDGRGVNTVDMGNISKLDAPNNNGGLNSGDVIAHEAMDAYYSTTMAESAADRAAAALFPGLYGPIDNKNDLSLAGTRVLGSTFSQQISDGRGSERVSIQYKTPIPAIDFFGKTPAQQNQLTHETGSRVTGVTYVPEQPK